MKTSNALWSVALAAGLLAGCGQRQERTRQYAEVDAKDVPVIPRQVLFGNPDRAAPQISPDGTQIAYLAPVNGVLNVWVGPVDDVASARPVTSDTHRGIRNYFWAYTNNNVLYLQDENGDENWHVFNVNLASGDIRDLTPMPGIAAQVNAVSYRHPTDILVAINNRNPQLHDVYHINIESGEMEMVSPNDGGFIAQLADDDYNVKLAMRMTPNGGTELLTRLEGASWTTFSTIDPSDTLTTAPVGFDKDGQNVFMTDSRGRNTSALTKVSLSTGEDTVLFSDNRVDIANVLMHPTENYPQAVATNYTTTEWNVLDDGIRKDFTQLRKVAPGEFEVVSRTQDDQQWVVAYTLDDGPVQYYRYDRGKRKAHFLFTNRPALEELPLSKMHPVVIKARDGKELVSYLTLPYGTDRRTPGRPDKPLPMVLFVHGGPWGRDAWGFNPYHQWLANRGYAVLSVNFRGSTGFGKEFINAADKQWAAKMHDDLIDATNWAVREKIANPARVGIMGGSYGGYATLVGLTFTPDVFACGVDIVGPSNLVTLLESIPPYWAPMVDLFTTRVGDHRTDEGRAFLLSRSPLTKVESIRKPLLIGQGANDPRVKQAEADQIVSAMTSKNIPVTYVLYPDEGHGFARPENRMSFNAVTEAFLAEYLGGRYEPIGDDFSGSSITVPTGAEQVPGVKQVLTQ